MRKVHALNSRVSCVTGRHNRGNRKKWSESAAGREGENRRPPSSLPRDLPLRRNACSEGGSDGWIGYINVSWSMIVDISTTHTDRWLTDWQWAIAPSERAPWQLTDTLRYVVRTVVCCGLWARARRQTTWWPASILTGKNTLDLCVIGKE